LQSECPPAWEFGCVETASAIASSTKAAYYYEAEQLRLEMRLPCLQAFAIFSYQTRQGKNFFEVIALGVQLLRTRGDPEWVFRLEVLCFATCVISQG
jgi:hypothetical protein